MRIRTFIPAAALALAVSACGAGVETVATVGGDEITYDEVIELMRFEGDTVAPELFTGTLIGLIVHRAIAAAANAEFDITGSEAEIDAEVGEMVGPLSGEELEDVLIANNLTTVGLRSIADQRVLQAKIEESLIVESATPPDEELRQRYDAVRASQSSVCSSHILLETEKEAQAAVDRALEGEDFPALAIELSTGPSGPNGGDLGCASPGDFVDEFADATLAAEIGVPFGPVQTQFGWHVILVSERTSPTFEELRDDLIAGMAVERVTELWDAWSLEVLEAADVVVEVEYGTWTTDPSPTIIPPGL